MSRQPPPRTRPLVSSSTLLSVSARATALLLLSLLSACCLSRPVAALVVVGIEECLVLVALLALLSHLVTSCRCARKRPVAVHGPSLSSFALSSPWIYRLEHKSYIYLLSFHHECTTARRKLQVPGVVREDLGRRYVIFLELELRLVFAVQTLVFE